jgi:hypothetical protein
MAARMLLMRALDEVEKEMATRKQRAALSSDMNRKRK